MPKKLLIFFLVALLALMPVMKANAYAPVDVGVYRGGIVSGVLEGGKISYVAEEIEGAELDSLVEETSARSDVTTLLQFARQMGYSRQKVKAYDIALSFHEQHSQKMLKSRALDISFMAPDDKNQVHLKFYDFVDNTVIGLVSYVEKHNGYQMINIYQVADGKVRLAQSIDTERMSAQCAGGSAASIVGPDQVVPASSGSCFACTAACGTFAALGCGLGLLACVAEPWICLALYAFCGAGFYTPCLDFCYSINACP